MTRSIVVLALLVPAAISLAGQTPQQASATPLPPPTNRWSADPAHSAIAFRVRHLGITWVNGAFGQWTADLNYDPTKTEAASVTAHIQAASISTGNLTMRGITHLVVLDADVGGVLTTPRGRRTAFSATTSLKRQDYGIMLNRFMEGAQIVG